METTTIRVFEKDKERIKNAADAKDQSTAEVVHDMLREPVFVCPECGEPFVPEEVDPATVREHTALTSGVDSVIRGERDVKDFECPTCEERVKPKDIDAADATQHNRATREDLGVTSESDKQEFSTEEA